MVDVGKKDYIVVVQCDIVREHCSGVLCEKAFHDRTGSFAAYPKDKAYRTLYITCGGCCGRATHRLLGQLKRKLKKADNIDADRIVVHLSSCVAFESFHAPECPHLDYLRKLIARQGLDVIDGTRTSTKAEERRKAGVYKARP
jgi:predicted metal-binding protein